MKILICSGIYPPDVGGPAKYAKNLAEEFLRQNHEVTVLHYSIEKKLPIGLRHAWFLYKIIFNIRKADVILALDMFSTGFPSVFAGKLFNKKTILRVGGDFLWETYVEKTGRMIKVRDFYESKIKLPFKHIIIRYLQKYTLEHVSAIAFNSRWQKEMYTHYYSLDEKRLFVIENYFPPKEKNEGQYGTTFLFAGRRIQLKNIPFMQEVFDELRREGSPAELKIIDSASRGELGKEMRQAHALITVSISDFAPNFIVEGISYGKPFILTKECGLVERVADLGILVDPTNKEEIKQAIRSLLQKNVYNNYVEKIDNFKFVHSWKDIANEFLNIYMSL